MNVSSKPLEVVRRNVHPGSVQALQWIADPAVLAGCSLSEIHNRLWQFELTEVHSAVTMTAHWGAAVGMPDARTSVDVVTTDGKAINVSIGRDGEYCIQVVSEDTAARELSPHEFEQLTVMCCADAVAPEFIKRMIATTQGYRVWQKELLEVHPELRQAVDEAKAKHREAVGRY